MTFDMKAAYRHADTGDLMKTTKWLYAALDEIAGQAASLDAAEALIRKNADRMNEMQGEIERLQKVVSEPVESFGTPELIEWAEGLQKIIAEYPNEERGQIPFTMTMGCHLEKFAKSWNSPAMQTQAKRIAELESVGAKWAKEATRLHMKTLKQRAALKKLGQAKRARGKALVEERARRICHVPGDPVGHWPRYEPIVIDEARKQLRQEGLL
jgi:cell division septum initiation protein DivIVA